MLQDCFSDFQILQTTSEPYLNSVKYDSKDFNESAYIRRPNKASIKCSQLLQNNRRHNSKDAHQNSDAEKTSGSESGISCSADDIESLNDENSFDLIDDCRPTSERKLLNSNCDNNNNATTLSVDNQPIYFNKTKQRPESLEAIKMITDEHQAFQIKNQDERKPQNVLMNHRYVGGISNQKESAREGFGQGIEDCKYLKGCSYDNQRKVQRQKRIITRSKQSRRLIEVQDINYRFTKRSSSKTSTVQNGTMKNLSLESAQQNKLITLRQRENVPKIPSEYLGFPHAVMDDRLKNIKAEYKKETCCRNAVFNNDPGLCLSKYLKLSPERKEYQHHHLNAEPKNMEDVKNLDNNNACCIKAPLRELSNSYLSNCSGLNPERMKDLPGCCQSFSMDQQQHLADDQGMSMNEARKQLRKEYQEKQMTLYRHYFHVLQKLNISKKESELSADLQMIEKLCAVGTNHCANISRSCSDLQKRPRSRDFASPKPTDARIDNKGSEFDFLKSRFESRHQKQKGGLLPSKPISNRTGTGPELPSSNFALHSNNTEQSYSYDNAYHKPFCDNQDFSRCKCSHQESSRKQSSVVDLHTKSLTKRNSKKNDNECSDHSCECEESLLPSLLQLQFQTTEKEAKYQKHKIKNSSGNITNSNNEVTSVLLQNDLEKDNSFKSKCRNGKEKSHIKSNDTTEWKSKPNRFSVRNPYDFMTANDAANILKNIKIKSEYSSQQHHYFILEAPGEKKTESLKEEDSFSKYASRDLQYPQLEKNKEILNKVDNTTHTSEDIQLYETISNEPKYEVMSHLRLHTSVQSGNLKALQKKQNIFKKIFRKTKNALTLHTSSV